MCNESTYIKSLPEGVGVCAKVELLMQFSTPVPPALSIPLELHCWGAEHQIIQQFDVTRQQNYEQNKQEVTPPKSTNPTMPTLNQTTAETKSTTPTPTTPPPDFLLA